MYHYILYISIYIYSHIPLYIIVIHDISLLIYHIALYICIIFVCIYIYQRPHVIDGYTVHSHLVSSFMDNYYLQICPNVDACSPGIFIPKKLCYFLIMFINFLCNMVSLWLFKKICCWLWLCSIYIYQKHAKTKGFDYPSNPRLRKVNIHS